MIELKNALSKLYQILDGINPQVEDIPIATAGGRYLAQDVMSQLDLPPFDKSAMDGFAIPVGSDLTQPMAIIETVQAGDTPSQIPVSGQCTRIMTGAPVPENTSQVIPVENTTETETHMTVIKQTGAKNICMLGEDVRAGDIIARKGTVLDSLNLPVLISCGVEIVCVYRQPKVTIFSTGNELVDTMADWGPGKIFDSNGPMLRELLRENNILNPTFHRLSDNRDETRFALESAITSSDMVVFSGGVSAGKFDFIPESLTQCGLTIHFSRLKVKPGKPMTFASGRNTLVFGFPGNPVSTWVMFHIFAITALEQLQGRQSQMRLIHLPFAQKWSRKKSHRQEFLPVFIDNQTGIPSLRCTDYHGSAHLSALQLADGLAIIPIGTTRLEAGDRVEFWPLRWSPLEDRY